MKDKLFPIKDDGVAITMACSDSYKAIMGVLLESIVENANQREDYDIVILEYDIPAEEKEKIRKYYQRDNIFVRFFNVKEALDQFQLYVRDYLSIMTYARLLIPQIFADFHRVLYLDCDIVCAADVGELYHRDMQGMCLYAIPDVILNMEAWNNPNSEDTKRYLEDIVGARKEGQYFNGGVIVFDIDAIKQENNSLFEIAEERQWKWADQDVLNYVYCNRVMYGKIQWNAIVIANFKQRRRYLKRSGLYESYVEALENPRIIHYAGEMLPCYRRKVPLEQFFWKYAKSSLYFDAIIKRKKKKTSMKREILDALAFIVPYDGKVRGMIKRLYKNKR